MANTLFTDRLFVSRLTPYVDRMIQKGPDLWNLRCPLCGDSKTNKRKARGYIFAGTDALLYKCHRCQANPPFGAFLKAVNPQLHAEYLMELFSKNAPAKGSARTKAPPPFVPPNKAEAVTEFTSHLATHLAHLDRLDQADAGHPAKRLLVERGIPSRFFSKLFYTPSYTDWLAEVYPEKAKDLNIPHEKTGRIVMPAYLPNKEPYAFTARAVGQVEPRLRYMTINETTRPLIFGLDEFDPTKRCYITEGYIDSMFLPNALASAGTNAHKLYASQQIDSVTIFDNEPRSPNITRLMSEAIKAGVKVFFWPPKAMGSKDINELVQKYHYTQDELVDMIERNSFAGLQAENRLAFWRKS